MSKPTATQITRIHMPSGGCVEVFREGSDVIVDNDGLRNAFTREEALLLVEAITARLAEVTEGQ